MNASELKAVLAKTNEVAVWPAHVESEPPYWADARRHGRIVCPTGLKRAVVIENGVKWIERRPVSECGDTDYDIPHRNGVLVELEFDSIKTEAKIVKNRFYLKRDGVYDKTPYPHTEIIERDGKKFVRMIVSRKVIGAPWGEYALREAERQKAQERSLAEVQSLREPQAALMGMTVDEFRKTHESGRRNDVYLGAEYISQYIYDRRGSRKCDSNGDPIVVGRVGRIQITLDQARKILSILTLEQLEALR